jgi:hypothetical protein
MYERFLLFNPEKKLAANSFYYIKLNLNNLKGIHIIAFPKLTMDLSLLTKEVPQTTYVHYINHRLDLVAFHFRKSIKSARNFFLLLNRQCVFWIGSAWQDFCIRISALLYIRKILLEYLSGIWWSCQNTSFSAVKETIPATLVTSAPCRMSNKRYDSDYISRAYSYLIFAYSMTKRLRTRVWWTHNATLL